MNPPNSSDATITLVIVATLYLVVSLAIFVWYAAALSRVFPKIGAEPWKAWVPVLNEAEIFARGGVPGWSVVFFFIPIVNFYALYLRAVATGRINAMFGRGTGMTVLALLLPPVWASLLATAGAPRSSAYDARIALEAPLSASPAISGLAAPRSSAETSPATPATPAGAPVTPPATTPTVTPVVAPPPPPQPDAPKPPPVAPVAVPPPPPQSDAPKAPPVAPVVAPPPPPQPDAPKPPPVAPVAVPPPPPQPDAPKAPPVAPVVVHNPWAARPGDDPAPEVAPAKAPRPTIITPPPAAPAPKPEPRVAAAVADVMIDAGAEPDGAEPDDDEYGETIVVDRRPSIRWTLNVDGVGPLPLPTAHVLLGRKPASTVQDTHALSVPDGTRTLSKVHARLDLGEDGWTITDLNSTNGVLVVGADGTETLLDPGAAVPVPGRFILGKVGMSISFEDASS